MFTWFSITGTSVCTPVRPEAQVGQGPISFHSEEHLATSDKGIAMLRRMMKKQIQVVREGGDPIGVVYDPSQAVQEPEGGIDNTLAAAFAQVRLQMAEQEASTGEPEDAEKA